MSNIQLLTTDDTSWQTILPADSNVFGSVEYARIHEAHSGYPAQLFVLSCDSDRIGYPFLRRSVASLPFINDQSTNYTDTITPDYTGPLLLTPSKNTHLFDDFSTEFADFCASENIVAEFAHLHPWDARLELLESQFVQYNRDIVFIDLTLSEDDLWDNSFSYACRKNIKRAKRENVRTFVAESTLDVNEFYEIYIHTMRRNNALDRYHYSLDYFLDYFIKMPMNARYVLAEHQGKIVAATLYLHDKDNVYSHLGGAAYDAQNVRPTNAIIYDTMLWAKKEGKKRFILGGGYRPNDGIYRFKSSFSPLTKQFATYRRIHLKNAYSSLCLLRDDFYKDDIQDNQYFPAYRAVPSSLA